MKLNDGALFVIYVRHDEMAAVECARLPTAGSLP